MRVNGLWTLRTKALEQGWWSLGVESTLSYNQCLLATHTMHINCYLGNQEVAWYAGWQCYPLIHGFSGAVITVPAAPGFYSDKIS